MRNFSNKTYFVLFKHVSVQFSYNVEGNNTSNYAFLFLNFLLLLLTNSTASLHSFSRLLRWVALINCILSRSLVVVVDVSDDLGKRFLSRELLQYCFNNPLDLETTLWSFLLSYHFFYAFEIFFFGAPFVVCRRVHQIVVNAYQLFLRKFKYFTSSNCLVFGGFAPELTPMALPWTPRWLQYP